MKNILFISAILSVLFSCKKEVNHNLFVSDSNNTLQQQLKDSMSNIDFRQVDFSSVNLSNYDNHNLTLVRIGFKNKPIAGDFILLKMQDQYHFTTGKLIHIERTMPLNIIDSGKFNGSVSINSFNHQVSTVSNIINGYIEAFHPTIADKNLKTEVVEIPTLPEVVIVSSYPGSANNPQSQYYSLPGIDHGSNTQNNGYPTSSGYYVNSDPRGAAANGSGESGASSGTNAETPMQIDFEFVEKYPPIDVNQYIKCFSSIPDAGATCTLKILTDIPVDKDPGVFFDWDNGSPGHTFLQFTKTNGSQSIQQNIGFYPDQGWKTGLTPAPVKGKFVDNADHEFNASLIMPLTPEKFQSALTRVGYLARFVLYDIDEYNCTDFALDVFNRVRAGNEITIPMYDLPGGAAPHGTSTPGGLYQKLKLMKSQGGSEANNILFPGVKGFAGISKGPCN